MARPLSRSRNPRLMLLAGIFSIMTGVMFVLLHARADLQWHRFLGVIWIGTDALWLTAWKRSRQLPGR